MNGVRVALATSIAVAILNSRPDALARFAAEPGVALASIAAGELLFGAANSGRHLANTRRYEGFISQAIVLPVTLTTARLYARLRLQLRQAGRPIPENDLWIAATCLEHNLVLGTADAHFSCCPDLATENGLTAAS